MRTVNFWIDGYMCCGRMLNSRADGKLGYIRLLRCAHS